jgi:energy-coupling factor transport system ATP-binding protein
MRIVLKDVTVRYDAGLPSATTALSGVSLAVEQGECVAVIGPTGSGKTTLLEVMAGLATPTSGVATIEPAGAARRLRDAVGLAYQAGLPDDKFGGRMPLSLSAGEKRRAAIAGILALSRPFLLLDEPTAGLDPSTAERIGDLVRNEVRTGRGVVVVTHDLEFVEAVASRTVVVGGGAVLADRTTAGALADASLLEGLGLEPPPRYALMDLLRRLSHPEFDRISLVLSVPHGAGDDRQKP